MSLVLCITLHSGSISIGKWHLRYIPEGDDKNLTGWSGMRKDIPSRRPNFIRAILPILMDKWFDVFFAHDLALRLIGCLFSFRDILKFKYMQKSEEPFLTLTLWDVFPLESPPHPELKSFFTLCVMKLIQDPSEHIQFVSAYGQLPLCNTDLKHILYISFLEGTTPIYYICGCICIIISFTIILQGDFYFFHF